MKFISISYLIPLLPLIGAAINGFVSFAGIKTRKWLTNAVACGSILTSFFIACGILYELHLLSPEERSITVTWFPWFDFDILKANVAFLIDQLSIVMVLVVSGVGFLIHVYSIGYMASDKGYSRFFSYLNLFCFAMLTLVLADNLLLMFVGWEGVGLCSYLLIGFWFDHKPNAVAGMKAFIVNRIGDFSFIIGMAILFWALYSVGHATVTFTELREYAGLLDGLKMGPFALVTVVCIALFIGATGKSAQIPLYIWLPDAMAGPTPVSALIHAATMVTAGVYMIGRMSFLYTMSGTALAIVATVGAVTAVFAATIGFAQNDIKKVLAYSTVSQLGYMFLGMGTSIYSAGIFHLVTHAFFKACLFLGAGSVILGMHHEQHMNKMGGLRNYMPVTFWTFFIATLALAGVFPLAGFFSKDEILWQVFSRGAENHLYYVLWGLGVAGALGTAFYMFRCVSMTFFGKLHTAAEHEYDEADALDSAHKVDNHHQPLTPQEQGLPITSVLVVLAVLSILGGFMGLPHALGKFIGMPNYFERWLEPVFKKHGFGSPTLVGSSSPAEAGHPSTEYLLMFFSVSVAVAGIFAAIWFYTKRKDLIDSFTTKWKNLYKAVLNKYYVDEIYNFIFIRPLLKLNDLLKAFDQTIIDGFVNGCAALGVFWAAVSGWWDWFFVDGAVNVVANATITSGRKLRLIQTGRIQHYFYIILFGLIVLLVWRVI
jgi:NADH-quinone oxidoreductase subunit L